MSDPTTPPPVTTPADLTEASLRDLLDAWFLHLAIVVDAHHHIGEPVPAEQVAAAALRMLASGQAIADRIAWSRWSTVADALRNGARLAAIAAALGVTEAEVDAGLMSWLRGQTDLHEKTGTLGLSEAEAEDLQVLAEDAATPVVLTVAELAAELDVEPAVVAAAVEHLAGSTLFEPGIVDAVALSRDVAAMVRLIVGGEHGTDTGSRS